MKKNNLILGVLLAITAILFSSFGASSSSGSPSTEKVEGSTESTESVGVVTIGSQVWTSKNLNVSTYRNGDVIPQVQDSSFKQFLSWQKNINQKIWVITKNQIDTNDKVDGKWFSFWGNTLIFGEDQRINDLKNNFHIDSISRNCFLVLFDTLLNERKNDPKQMVITFNESGITDDGYNNPIQKIIEIRLDSYRLIAESSGNEIPSAR
jgi:hypothetical protein